MISLGKYLFISDLHGRYSPLEYNLSLILKNQKAPEIIFFLGDIIGIESLDYIKRLFYDQIINPTKTLLSTSNNDISDIEILKNHINNEKNVADVSQELWSYLYSSNETLSVIDIIVFIKGLLTYDDFGDFIRNIRYDARYRLQKIIEKNIDIWVSLMKKFIEKDSQIVVVEGNWDACSPLDHYASASSSFLPVEKRSFSLKNYLQAKDKNVLYLQKGGTIETEKEIFLIWPFSSAINDDIPPEINRKDKKLILVSHAHVDWGSIKGTLPINEEDQILQTNMQKLAKVIRPDYIVHGHLHDQAKNYFFDNIKTYYLPFRHFSFIDFDQ